jgi:hypothetical protein
VAVSSPLKLRAEDGEDLKVVAAFLQDALVRLSEMTYQRRRKRFVAALNRFMWEDGAGAGGAPRRVRCGLHFNGVLETKVQGLTLGGHDRLLELLTLTCDQGEDAAATVTLVFAGGPRVCLEVECVDCHLVDLGPPWQARSRPEHGLESVD